MCNLLTEFGYSLSKSPSMLYMDNNSAIAVAKNPEHFGQLKHIQLCLYWLRDVIEQSKLLLLSKNHGDLLQDFIWQTQKISAEDAPSVNSPLNKETAQQHGQQALEGLRTLGNLLITNGQFRKLCEYFQGERVCALKADFFDSE